MKKMRLLSVLVLTIAASFSFGQSFPKGTKLISIGIGPGGEKPGGHTGYKTNYNLGLPPFVSTVNVQYAIMDNISVGGYFGAAYSTANTSGREYEDRGNFDGKGKSDIEYKESESDRMRSVYYVGVKGEYHLSDLVGLIDELDWYAGAAIGSTFRNERLYNGKSTTTTEYYDNTDRPYRTDVSTSEWDSSYDPGDDIMSFGILTGARYYFKENLAAYLEIGLGFRSVTYAQVGLAFKLK